MPKKKSTKSRIGAHSAAPMKREIKASVFTDLFGEPRYAILLYRFLHPEDVDATESDVEVVTIENILTDNVKNDLGLLIGDRLLILVEHQEKLDPNMPLRAYVYIAHSYNEYLKTHNIDLHSGKKINLPKPEIYMVYTGASKNVPKKISLHDEFFPGTERTIDLIIKVITGGNPGDVVSQYFEFTRICKEQYALYRDPRVALREIFRICIERNVLREYLLSKEKEVTSIMISLYDAEEIQERFIARIRREEREETEARLNKEHSRREAQLTNSFNRREAQLKKSAEKAAEKAAERTRLSEATATAKELLANTNLSVDVIAKSVRLSVAEVEKLAKRIRK